MGGVFFTKTEYTYRIKSNLDFFLTIFKSNGLMKNKNWIPVYSLHVVQNVSIVL